MIRNEGVGAGWRHAGAGYIPPRGPAAKHEKYAAAGPAATGRVSATCSPVAVSNPIGG